jgi:hypothetical protein
LDTKEAPCVDAVTAMLPTNATISARIFACLRDPQRAMFRDGD